MKRIIIIYSHSKNLSHIFYNNTLRMLLHKSQLSLIRNILENMFDINMALKCPNNLNIFHKISLS